MRRLLLGHFCPIRSIAIETFERICLLITALQGNRNDWIPTEIFVGTVPYMSISIGLYVIVNKRLCD